MNCAEIMTSNPEVCVPEDNISIAANLMWEYDCGAVPVVKNRESSELVGIITDRDIAMHLARCAYVHPAQATVGDCMSFPVVNCRPDDPIEILAQMMSEYQIRRVPIADENGCCMGIISQADLLSNAATMESVVNVLQHISAPHIKSAAASEETAETDESPAEAKEKKAKD